ncbi:MULTISPECIES: SDR family NAD(P)-dependent oxidoreductase [unclassified Mesorhizobium]|uniref:SDR family NAD(P)-dependent oxidoreductase n=1 Tax=unclassified Mesorhizobium TaxID=325217 RepID=UPI00112B15AB|nr:MULTISPECIES: SDR family NAD(P)-dependent oxidoreductase [unclassified Mesorhizobium]TPJ41366.1 SDR family oxidoreductase [Mesorhizobium sp. B2-6-6]MBZ9702799.1 SDR family oxidoreductase [Mesorhizobium sp. CO1-1-3]MBZ9948482.1 SDR family oxidoreductase [Mesorhizobium sp. BR1-1-11]MCA0002388.1 SDR family oxidoreductase [Mesorhizobium sp. B264B2A]MCA0008298.1 SDR family oxidoreductase [Mesorhizobium sp. B264B1B]
MNRIDLDGQHAVVTGGAQGLGFAMAKRFVASGATVTLWDVDEARLEAAKRDLGKAATTLVVDIADWETVDAARAKTEESAGKISILVNSAGIAGPAAPLDSYDIETWKKIIDINVNGTFYANRAVVPGMKARNYGRIVNIASVAGKEGNPNAAAYSASKAAVIGMTKSLGKELAQYDIAVNCISPATAQTRILEQLTPEHIEYMRSRIPRGRLLEVDEAAAMVAWLVSKENSFTTASTFDLSGGRTTY